MIEPDPDVRPDQVADMLLFGGPLGLLLIPLAKVMVWVKRRALRR